MSTKNFPMAIIAFTFFPLMLECGFATFFDLSAWFAGFFAVIKALILCIPFVIFPKYTKKLLWIIYFFVYVPLLINLCHILLFKCTLNECSMHSMFETTIGESIDFVEHFGNPVLIAFALIYLIVPASYINLIAQKSQNLKNFSLRDSTKIILSFVCVAGYMAFAFGDGRFCYPFENIFGSYIKYKWELYNHAKIRDERKNFAYGEIKNVIKTDKKQTYIVVIGESVDKKHMSLYGYERKTTPNFDKIKDELYVFKNVNSSYCQTNKVMRCLLLFDEDFSKGDIISFLNKAGFKTFWFSNQYTSGKTDTTACLVGTQASDFTFINRSHFRMNRTSSLDENLLKYLDTALQDKSNKKVIFLHLIGSHGIYENRYPKNFDLFTSKNFTKRANKVATYDNSIAYTDSILIKIIEKLKCYDNDLSLMIYLSDHGEDAYDNDTSTFSHTFGVDSPHMFDIPVIMWVSNGFKKARREFLEHIDVEKIYKTKTMIHSFLDLFGLEHELIRKEDSLFR